MIAIQRPIWNLAMSISALTCCLGATFFAAGMAWAEDEGPVEGGQRVWLEWRNGDRLEGELMQATEQTVTLSSSLFAAPLVVERSMVGAIKRMSNQPAGAAADGAVRVELTNGDVLFGKLAGVSAEALMLESPRHGKIAVLTSKVYRLSRAAREEVIFESGGRLDEWKAFEGELDYWEERIGGGIVTTKFGAGVVRAVELPEKCRIKVAMNWNEGPGFSLMFVSPSAASGTKGLFGQLAKGLGLQSRRSQGANQSPQPLFHLTLWDDELVLETRTGFTSVATLDKSAKELRLDVMWDRKEGKIWVLAGEMKQAREVDVPKFRSGWQTGVYFKNYGKDIELESVHVLKWNGEIASSGSDSAATVLMVDGREFASPVKSFDAKSQELVLEDDTHISFSEVAQIYWNREFDQERADIEQSDRIRYLDGSILHGTLEKIEDGAGWIKTDYCAESLRCEIDQRFASLELAAQDGRDEENVAWVLKAPGGRLRGRVGFVEVAGKGRLAWQPAGAVAAVPLVRDMECEIEKIQEEPLESVITVSAMPSELDVLYLKNGDVVPAKAFALEGNELTYRLGTGKERKIDVAQLRAVGFQRDSVSTDLVKHPKWKDKASRPTDIKRDEDRIEFYSSGRTENPELLTIPAVSFRTRSRRSQFCQVDISMFGAEPNRLERALHLGLYLSGRQIYYSFHFGEDEQGYSQFPGSQGKSTLDWTIEIRDDEAVVSVDGEEINRIDVPKSFKVGRGMRIHVEQGSRSRKPILTISNLALLRVADPFAAVSEKDKQIILQVPRRYRRRPPSHILLARTGDLLRGRLNGFDEQAVQFTVRTVPQKIPRSRLAGVLWLDRVAKSSDGADRDKETDKQSDDSGSEKSREPVAGAIRVLTADTRITMVPERIEEGRLIGRSPFVGEFSLAVDDVLLLEAGTSLRKIGEAAFEPWQPKIAEAPEVPMGGQ